MCAAGWIFGTLLSHYIGAMSLPTILREDDRDAHTHTHCSRRGI